MALHDPQVHGTLTAFRSDPARRFSDGEIAPVVAFIASGTDGPDRGAALDLLLVHYSQRGEHRAALTYAKQSFALKPDEQTASNIAVLHRNLGEYREAIDFLTAVGDQFDDKIFIHDLMCSCGYRMGNTADAIRHGRAALLLKHERAMARAQAIATRPHRPRPFNPDAAEKNIISFSLYGAGAKYLRGALLNAVACRYVYPGWRARFYLDASVPADLRTQLQREGAQVVMVDRHPAFQYGMFWRLFVDEDPAVDRYIIRDADSVVNLKESIAVHDWCRGPRAFHIMRDHIMHSELIHGGLWGGTPGVLVDPVRAIEAFVEGLGRRSTFRIVDQMFLRDVLWPAVWRNALIHDDCYDLFGAVKFPGTVLPRTRHIGQDESIFFKPVT